jgi:hypothetical protein
MAGKCYETVNSTSPDDWYWCLECNRFFQARSLRMDFQGNREGCAFCDAAGLGVDLWPWDAFRTRGWPRDTSELRHGLVRR